MNLMTKFGAALFKGRWGREDPKTEPRAEPWTKPKGQSPRKILYPSSETAGTLAAMPPPASSAGVGVVMNCWVR